MHLSIVNIENAPKFARKIKVSDQITELNVLSLSKNEDFMVCAGMYPINIKESQEANKKEDFLLNISAKSLLRTPVKVHHLNLMVLSQFNIAVSSRSFYDAKKLDYDKKIDIALINLTTTGKNVDRLYNKGLHDGAIYEVATCKHKSIIATLSGKLSCVNMND